MIRTVTILFSLFAMCAAANAQVAAGFDLSNYGVRIEPDRRVIVTLAAIEAARTTNTKGESVPVINTTLSAEGSKFREVLKSDLAALNDEVRQKISNFMIRHKASRPNATDAELISPFISMAHTLAPVPDLGDPVITNDLPGSLLDVLDFAPLVREFYRSSSIRQDLDGYVKLYLEQSDNKLRPSSREMVSELLSYLQTRPQTVVVERTRTETQRSSRTTLAITETRERERRFFIVPEMLAPVGTVTFLNIKDDYYAILPPDTDLNFSDVRRGYLQYVIDPIVFGMAKDIETIREGVRQMIEERRKTDRTLPPDVYLTISRSLVAAIDAKQVEKELADNATRQARARIGSLATDADKRAFSAELDKIRQMYSDDTILRLSEDYDRGALLVFYFADQLRGVEDSGFDIAASLKDMILSFDAQKEKGRYDGYADVRKRALANREARRTAPATTFLENPVTTRLLAVQELIAAKNYAKADADLKLLLKDSPEDPRVFYTVGRVAGLAAQAIDDEEQLQEKLLESKTAYENVIRLAQAQRVDPALISLTYVALGRIYEFYGDKTYAISVYDQAIKLGPITGGAHGDAIAAKARLIKEQ